MQTAGCTENETFEDLNSLQVGKALSEKPKNICGRDPDGKWYIDNDALGARLADIIELPIHLKKRTNPEGRVTAPDFVYAFSSDRPFGPMEPGECEKRTYRAKIFSLVSRVDHYLRGSIKESKTFKIYKDDVEISTRPDIPRPTLQTLFAKENGYRVKCQIGEDPANQGSVRNAGGKGRASGSAEAGGDKRQAGVSAGDFRIGAAPEDLFKTTKKSKQFTIGIGSDNVKDQTNVAVDGVVGMTFALTGSDFIKDKTQARSDLITRDLWWLNYAVYGQVKIQDQQPDSSQKPDISYFAPGVAVNYTFIRHDGNFAYDLRANASPFFDTKNGSVFYAGDVAFSPSFRIGETLFLGAPLTILGPLKVVPDLSLVSRYVLVEDAGKNAEFKDVDNYFSLGYDAAAEFYLLDVSDLLSNLSVTLGYQQRLNTDGVQDAERFVAALNYKPASENFTVSLQYTNGPDLNTLQEEERTQLNIGIKY